MRRKCGRKRAKQVDVVNLNPEVQNLTAKFYRFLSQKRLKTSRDPTRQSLAPVFRYPNEMIVEVVRRMSGSLIVHRTIVLCSFQKSKLTERSGKTKQEKGICKPSRSSLPGLPKPSTPGLIPESRKQAPQGLKKHAKPLRITYCFRSPKECAHSPYPLKRGVP
jgi:hypothetical protein